MNVTDSDNDMGNFEEGNRDKIRLRIIFMCFAIGVGVGVMGFDVVISEGLMGQNK